MERIELDTDILLGVRVCEDEYKDEATRETDPAKRRMPASVGLKEGPTPQKRPA